MKEQRFEQPLRVDVEFIPKPTRGNHYSKKDLEALRMLFYDCAMYNSKSESWAFEQLKQDADAADRIIKKQCEDIGKPKLFDGFFAPNNRLSIRSNIFNYGGVIYMKLVDALRPTEFSMRYGSGLTDGWKWLDTKTWTYERLIDWYVGTAPSLFQRCYDYMNGVAFDIWEPKTPQAFIDSIPNLPANFTYGTEAATWLRARYGFEKALVWGRDIDPETLERLFPDRRTDNITADDLFDAMIKRNITVDEYLSIVSKSNDNKYVRELKIGQTNTNAYKRTFMQLGEHFYEKKWKVTQANVTRIIRNGPYFGELRPERSGFRFIPKFRVSLWQIYFPGEDVSQMMDYMAAYVKKAVDNYNINNPSKSNAISYLGTDSRINAEEYYWQLAGGRPAEKSKLPVANDLLKIQKDKERAKALALAMALKYKYTDK